MGEHSATCSRWSRREQVTCAFPLESDDALPRSSRNFINVNIKNKMQITLHPSLRNHLPLRCLATRK